MMPYLSVAIGGFFGAIFRYGLAEAIPTYNGVNIATLLTNWAGCFVLAWLNSMATHRLPLHPHVRLGITTGLLGAFTTFSTFTIDAWKLFTNGQIIHATGYVLLSILGGLFFSYIGYLLANSMSNAKQGVA